MHKGRTVFAQLMEFLPKHEFDRCVERYHGDLGVRGMTCYDQFLIMAFAQVTSRESLRDIAIGLQAQSAKLYHCGIRSTGARSTHDSPIRWEHTSLAVQSCDELCKTTKDSSWNTQGKTSQIVLASTHHTRTLKEIVRTAMCPSRTSRSGAASRRSSV